MDKSGYIGGRRGVGINQGKEDGIAENLGVFWSKEDGGSYRSKILKGIHYTHTDTTV